MSQCSKDLDPLFDEIAEKAVRQQRYRYRSKEWTQLERELVNLRYRADTIFYHYNPSYKGNRKSL